jgi:ATP-binding cassette subfamily F protein 3
VILISHDRHMVELTADRLVLVDNGTALGFDGAMDDYIDFVLGRNQPKGEGEKSKSGGGGKVGSKADRKANAQLREQLRGLKKKVIDAEAQMAKLQAEISALDRAMFEPSRATGELAKLSMGELSRRRGVAASKLEAVEASWMALSETYDAAFAEGQGG